jgi:hypothetical protein
LLHHDGITGTQQSSTEEDYYVILHAAQEYLTKAREIINAHFSNPILATLVNFKTDLLKALGTSTLQ